MDWIVLGLVIFLVLLLWPSLDSVLFCRGEYENPLPRRHIRVRDYKPMEGPLCRCIACIRDQEEWCSPILTTFARSPRKHTCRKLCPVNGVISGDSSRLKPSHCGETSFARNVSRFVVLHRGWVDTWIIERIRF
ncbi:hypothetical protein SISNIDRAFT_471354 [Sistotremastrum niveocremeum HHB9708]|uniref:Uncharacterized protein n=1 Tax=Sistotremastrum niveocremeum HHB9708 TaxID=1314777 RepID=A0A164MRW9_9AGAM|nr:hypothetical protein SISNIDRAFT_471354 [Sistotremastrum niveocremeum HHB9708]